MAEVRGADIPGHVEAVRRLWLDYLTWGNDEMEARYAFRLPVEETVEQDLGSIAKFQPPDGRLLLAFENGVAIGTASMRRIGSDTAEIKRMYVDPSYRLAGSGRAMLDLLIAVAIAEDYRRIRLDSPDFLTAAHGLYRSREFVFIEPYPETEIPDDHQSHWVFIARIMLSTFPS